jgi:glycerophosphoryl diester phosphodiesterase
MFTHGFTNRSTLVVLAVATGALGVGTAFSTAAAPASPPANTPTLVELASTAPSCERDRVVVVGHRGIGPGTRSLYGTAHSEDTIGAFRAAMRVGADGFETDFWPTADNQVVSHHDATVTRMTDGTGTIWSRTAEEVEDLRNESHERLPTFREVLSAMLPEYPDVHVQQEFKDGRMFSDAVLLRLARLDREFVGDVGARVLITASQLSTLRRFHRLAPDLPTGLIDRSSGRPRLSTLPSWLDVILIEFGAADATYIRRASARGHEVSVREVDSVSRLREAARMGATRVVTDRPELLGRAC